MNGIFSFTPLVTTRHAGFSAVLFVHVQRAYGEALDGLQGSVQKSSSRDKGSQLSKDDMVHGALLVLMELLRCCCTARDEVIAWFHRYETFLPMAMAWSHQVLIQWFWCRNHSPDLWFLVKRWHNSVHFRDSAAYQTFATVSASLYPALTL